MSGKLKIIATFLVILYILPLIILGQNSSIMIWDNLDSYVALFKILASSGQIFGGNDAIIPDIMNGVPRMCFGSEFNFILLLYYWFQPFTAYCINEILIHSFALIGMYVFLQKYIISNEEDSLVLFGASVAFALLPFWSPGGLSVAGQPLIIYAFLNIRQGQSSKIDWLILLLLPFYSSFVLSEVFLLFMIGLLWICDFIKTRKANYKFGIAIVFMTALYLVIEYRLVLSMLMGSNFISHRLEFENKGLLIGQSLKLALQNFMRSQAHVNAVQFPLIITTIIGVMIILKKKASKQNLLPKLLAFIFVVAVFFGFWQWSEVLAIKKQINIMRMFQFDRFYWLTPFAWYVAWALALKVIMKCEFNQKTKIVGILITLQIMLLFAYNLPFANVVKGVTHYGIKQPSYREFYAEKLFDEIKLFIGGNQKDYKVVSLGIHPSVLQYNGFYTLDAYMVNYPLEYKHNFRKIIATELNKNDEIKKYFDNWGSRCYIFSAELGKDKMVISKNQDIVVNNLEMNNLALRELGGEYVVSAVKIINNDKNGLQFLHLFEQPDSLYRVYLYKVIAQ